MKQAEFSEHISAAASVMFSALLPARFMSKAWESAPRSPGRCSLTAKLDVVAELANELALQTRGILAGDVMFARAPCGGRMFAGQELRTKAERNQIGPKPSLARITPVERSPGAD